MAPNPIHCAVAVRGAYHTRREVWQTKIKVEEAANPEAARALNQATANPEKTSKPAVKKVVVAARSAAAIDLVAATDRRNTRCWELTGEFPMNSPVS